MPVKVLITRWIFPEKTLDVLKVLNRLRAQALEQPGYLGGQTLWSRKDKRKLLVISTWTSAEAWQAWQNHPKRSAIEQELGSLLSAPTEYEIFDFGSYPPSDAG